MILNLITNYKLKIQSKYRLGVFLNFKKCEIFTSWYDGQTVGALLRNGYSTVRKSDLFIVEDDQYPIILKMALQSEILLETFIILNKILGFVGRWTEISDTVIWPIYKRKALKYSAFFANMNISEYKDILRSLFVV